MTNADHNVSTGNGPFLQDILVQLDGELVRVEIHLGGMRSVQETMRRRLSDGDADVSSALHDIKVRLDTEVDRVETHLGELRALRGSVRTLIDATDAADPAETLLPG